MKLYICMFLLNAGAVILGGVVIPHRCRPEYKRDSDECEGVPDNIGECRRLADVAFVLDASRSIGKRAFNEEKQFFQKILGAFEVGSDRSRFAAITFSDRTVLEFNLNTYSDESQILAAVNNIHYADGPATLMYQALNYTRYKLLTRANGNRDDVPDIVILVTDGETNPGKADPGVTKKMGLRKTQEQANLLKQMGVSIFTIGVGRYINEGELQTVASEPSYYLKVKSYEELNTDAIVKKISDLTCEVTKPPSPPPCPNRRLMEYEARVKRESPVISVKQVCKGKPVDILFILDQSTSLGNRTNFQKELDFANAIIENMDFEEIQVSVIKFSDKAKFEIKFNQYKSMQALSQAISNIRWEGGSTYTNSSLNLMLTQGFTAQNGARQGVDKVGVIITDGGSTEPDETRKMAAAVQQAGITMFAIGVGPEFAGNERNNLAELQAIASDPDEDFLYTVDDISALSSVQEMISKRVCTDVCNTEPIINCRDLAADVVFLLDSSTSLGSPENFRKELSFVSDLVSSFDVSPKTTRVAAISFASNATVEFHLDTYGSRAQVQNAIASIPYYTGDTHMHEAFEKMLSEEFTGRRGNRRVHKKICIILTDGNPTDQAQAEKQAERARENGIRIFTIGIGPSINNQMLETIASKPASFFTFQVASLDTLADIRKKMRLRVCTDKE